MEKQRRGRVEGRRQWLYRFTTVTSVLITCHRGRRSVEVLWLAVRLPEDNARHPAKARGWNILEIRSFERTRLDETRPRSSRPEEGTKRRETRCKRKREGKKIAGRWDKRERLMDGPEGKKLKRGEDWIEGGERERSKTKIEREGRSAAGPVGNGGISEDMQTSELDSFLRRVTPTRNVPDHSPRCYIYITWRCGFHYVLTSANY